MFAPLAETFAHEVNTRRCSAIQIRAKRISALPVLCSRMPKMGLESVLELELEPDEFQFGSVADGQLFESVYRLNWYRHSFRWLVDALSWDSVVLACTLEFHHASQLNPMDSRLRHEDLSSSSSSKALLRYSVEREQKH